MAGSVKENTIIITGEDRFSNVAAKVAGSLNKIAKQTGGLGTKLENMGRVMQRVGRVLSVELTAPIVYLAKTSVDAFVEMDTAVRRLQKVFDGTVEQMRADLIPASKEMAMMWGMNQVEIVGVMEELAAMGFKTEEILDGTARAVEVSKLGNLDLAGAMDLVVAVMQNYGVRGEELIQTIADLNAVEDAGAAKLSDMAVGLARVASIGKEFGLGVKEVGAFMSVLIARGEQTTIGARALRTTFSRLLAPTGAIADLLDELGISTEKATKEMTTMTRTVGGNADEMKRLEGRMKTTTASLADYEAGSRGANLTDEERSDKLDGLRGTLAVLEDQYNAATGAQETYTGMVEVGTGKLRSAEDVLFDLAEKWETLTEVQRNQMAQTIAGRHHVDRFIKIMDDLTSGQSEYMRIMEETADPLKNQNRMQKQLGIELDSAAVSVGRLKEQWKDFQRFLGRDILPIVIPIIEKLLELTVKFKGLDDGTRKTIITFVLLLAALGPFLIFAGLLVQSIGALIIAVKALGTAILWLIPFMLAHPFIALTVGVAALTTAIGYLIIKSDILKSKHDLLTDAQNREAEAARNLKTAKEELARAYDDIVAAELREESAKLALERAELSYVDAVKSYGPASLQAREASNSLKRAELELKLATEGVTKAVEDGTQAIKDHDAANRLSNEMYAKRIENLGNEYDGWDRLKIKIGETIDKVIEWSRLDIKIPIIGGGGGGESHVINRQHGGIIPGPIGAPVPILAHAGERVVPRSGADVGGGTGSTVNINITGQLVVDNETRVNELADRIGRMLGRQNELARYGLG